MRVHSRWFREGQAKPPEALAHAAAFIAWRQARAALQRMRGADFEIAAGPQYFTVLAEFLAFLLACADRTAYAKLPADDRVRFTQALGQRLAEIWAENRRDLLGDGEAASLIEHLNARQDDYAACAWTDGQPDFAFLRCLASALAPCLPEPDQSWVHDQVMEIEGPEAAATLHRALLDLYGLGTRPRRSGAALAGGD